MGMDIDYIAGKQAIEKLEKLFSDQEHGEREEIADEIRVESVEETVVEEAHVAEPKDDESTVEEISELSISETNEETSSVSTSSEDILR
jgi:hypothetical protein